MFASTSFPVFIYDQLVRTLPYPTTSHRDQVILVTGSNVGLGLEAARHFVRLDAAKVILAVRNVSAGEAAKKDIDTTTNKLNVVEVWPLDLGSHASVRENVERAQKLDRLDVVVENAGFITRQWKLVEGEESQVSINTISTLLHALLILPKMEETARKINVVPHLVIVCSNAHGWTRFPQHKAPRILEELRDEKKATTFAMSDRYGITKLLELLYVRELANQQRHPEVVINTTNPGMCYSQLTREKGWIATLVAGMQFVLARSTEEGSRTTVHAASAGMETRGKYLDNCQATE